MFLNKIILKLFHLKFDYGDVYICKIKNMNLKYKENINGKRRKIGNDQKTIK
ncbi:hypothetical protein BDCR2A_01437 [Borrelia duttonii CR2A]|uniref:Uncharacterized protein n=1 Tax=Borrelia duttonii CR2A TaxID=1432657 RepID=W6TX24_9SPIR|nr:hypothetical protein BDCR2A_01437 [Borrelia duttonii CR2A]